MVERRHERGGDRLKTDLESGHREDQSVETPLDPSQARDSDITADPLDELDVAGREMFEQVQIGLGLVSGPQHRQIGRFVLGRCLGAGGMGVVHLAQDPQLGRDVAIKRIRPRPYLSSKILRTRLEREARALAQLHHPNVVHVYEFGEHEGEVFLAMEYVAGETLSKWQSAPQRTRAKILGAYVDAGKGIAAAHAAQVIHRDFKPENVLVAEDGHVRVGDFGLAALLQEIEVPTSEAEVIEPSSSPARLTQTGELLGTLPYMAPERLRGQPGDARGDQFSFCVALWEALTGQLPFAGDEQVPLRERILSGALRDGEGLPRWLRSALKRGLSVKPEQRYADMNQLVSSLERGLGRPKRWLLGGAFSVAGGIAIVSGMYGLTHRSPQEPCDLEGALAATSELAEWEPLREELGADAVQLLLPLERHLQSLTAQSERICQADDTARMRQAIAWLEDLRRLLDSPGSGSTERLHNYIEWLTDERLQGPPPRPLGDEVVQAINASEASELANDLDGALQNAEDALQNSQWEFEKADALIRRGRVRSLRGDHQDALTDFHEARGAADRGKYDDARLRANLLAAELMIKRLDMVEAAAHYLDDGEAVAFRIREPMISPRRAAYDELQAVMERRRGRTDAALVLQLRALLRRHLAGDPPYLIARNLAGMAIIAEARGDAELVERCYRAALAKLPGPSPDRYQVAYLFGRWLAEQVFEGTDVRPEEARMLLREAIEGRLELRLEATSNLLLMELQLDDPSSAVAPLTEQLAIRMHTRAGNRTQRSEAWQTLAMAFAAANDLPKLEEAAREAYALIKVDDLLALARFEVSVASFAVDPEIRQRYAVLARSGLEQLPSSEQREALLEATADLLSGAP